MKITWFAEIEDKSGAVFRGETLESKPKEILKEVRAVLGKAADSDASLKDARFKVLLFNENRKLAFSFVLKAKTSGKIAKKQKAKSNKESVELTLFKKGLNTKGTQWFAETEQFSLQGNSDKQKPIDILEEVKRKLNDAIKEGNCAYGSIFKVSVFLRGIKLDPVFTLKAKSLYQSVNTKYAVSKDWVFKKKQENLYYRLCVDCEGVASWNTPTKPDSVIFISDSQEEILAFIEKHSPAQLEAFKKANRPKT